MQRVKTAHSAWMMISGQGDNTSQLLSDGSVYLGTPVDILFVILPFLERSQGRRFVPSSDLFSFLDSAASPHLGLLCEPSEPHLGVLCDVKVSSGEPYYRLNDERVVAWIEIKMRMTEEALEEGGVLGGLDERGRKAYALGFLGDYLGDKWIKRVAERLDIQLVTNVGQTRPPPSSSVDAEAADVKKQKIVATPKVDPKAAAKKKVDETKAAKVAKAAEGTKSITSFFCKK